MKQYFAPIETAVESWMDDEHGVRTMGRLNVGVTVFEADDVVSPRALPLADLLAKHIDPATGLITLAGGPVPATMDPIVLSDVPLTAWATLSMRFLETGPTRETPSCPTPHPLVPSCEV